MRVKLKAIATTHGLACLTVGAPALCALLIASISVPLAMWAPILEDAKVSPLRIVANRAPHEITGVLQPQLTGFDARVADARAYLVKTARAGFTMTRQGPLLAIARLHPEFVLRLANAVREARAEGLEGVGIYSAYRPPALRVGGFRNKFRSLHSYGLAVDVYGIGRPGSEQTRLWHRVAEKNGLSCPYGVRNRSEWNHCQPTRTKIILARNPLSKTINAEGPISLDRMWATAKPLIIKADDLAEPTMAKLRGEIAQLEAPLKAKIAAHNNKRDLVKVERHMAHRHMRVAARVAITPEPLWRWD